MTIGGIPGTKSTYAGDITVQETWELLTSDPEAILVDVRTNAEWAYVGIPDLSSLNKSVQLVSWVLFPDMAKNEGFVEEVSALQPNKSAPLIFLCRSGVRSIAAAEATTQAGFSKSYNVLEGFEGAPDQSSHRGTVGGWKVAGLDWKQG